MADIQRTKKINELPQGIFAHAGMRLGSFLSSTPDTDELERKIKHGEPIIPEVNLSHAESVGYILGTTIDSVPKGVLYLIEYVWSKTVDVIAFQSLKGSK